MNPDVSCQVETGCYRSSDISLNDDGGHNNFQAASDGWISRRWERYGFCRLVLVKRFS
jgi:hypothetical protein